MKIIIILVWFITYSCDDNQKICIQGIYKILEYKKMEYGKTLNTNINLNSADNYFYKGTLFFWLKQVNKEKNVYDFNILSLNDGVNQINISFNWIYNKSTMNINDKAINISHKNNTWAYYGLDIEYDINNKSVGSTKINVDSIYKVTQFQNAYTKLPFKFNLKNLKISVGNFNDKIFDEFNGEIYDLKLYNGLVKNKEAKYNTVSQEPELIYFIDFSKFPSNTQIFVDTAGNNYPHSINGSSDESVDINDLNNVSISDFENVNSNDFIINQPYQYIKLPNEWLEGINKHFYQKSVYFNLRIHLNTQYAKTTQIPDELYIYRRLNSYNNANLASISLKTNSFTLDSSNLKNNVNSNILFKDDEIKCKLLLDISDTSSNFNLLNIKYMILILVKNPFKPDFINAKLIYVNYNYCLVNLKRNFLNNDKHFIGNPLFNGSLVNIPTVYSIRILEFGFFNGGDFNDINSCIEGYEKISGKNFKSFSISCNDSNLLDREKNFYNCDNKNIGCKVNIPNCEICKSTDECLYCKNGYKVLQKKCYVINYNEVVDVINKKISKGTKIDLSRTDDVNLTTVNQINFNKDLYYNFKWVLPNSIKDITLKQKNIVILDEYSYFSEKESFNIYFSILKKSNVNKNLLIRLIHDNTSPPSANYIFNFGSANNSNLYYTNTSLDCNLKENSINFPCQRCSNKKYKIIKNIIFSECVGACPPKHYIKDFICFPCHNDCKSCKGPTVNKFCECKYGYRFLNNKCIKCDTNCGTCDFNSNYCTSCKKGYYLEKKYNYFGFCKKCHDNCEICSDNEETECIKCKKGWILHDTICIKKCPETFFLNKNGVCNKCPSFCKFCKDENNCNMCISDTFFLININNQIKCKKCSDNCKVCTSNPNKCIACDFGYSLVNNVCEATCEVNQYKNLNNKHECIDCDKCDNCYSNYRYNCYNCNKCRNICQLEKIKIDDNTFEFKINDFNYDKEKIRRWIKVYNSTSIVENELDYSLFFNYNPNIFILKLNTKNYKQINIKINKYFNKKSKNCIFKDETIINNITQNDSLVIIVLGKFLKFTNLIIYIIAIFCCLFWESLSNKLIDVFKLAQFFKYFLLFNLNLEIYLQEFFVISNSNNIITVNFFNDKTNKLIEEYLKNYIEYKPLEIINLNIWILKSYFILFLITLSFVLYVVNLLLKRKKESKIQNLTHNDFKDLPSKKNIEINITNLFQYNKLTYFEFLLKKIALTMLRLDSINIFFLSIAFFKTFYFINNNYNIYLFINAFVFLFINTIGYIYLFYSTEWLELKLNFRKLNIIKKRLIDLLIMMSKKLKGFHVYLSIFEEIKYSCMILVLILFKKYIILQLILTIWTFLLFYIILSFSLVKDSNKYLLYFFSETMFLIMLFPLIFSIFFEVEIYFSILLIIFILFVYILRFLILIYYISFKIKKKIKYMSINKVSLIKPLDIFNKNTEQTKGKRFSFNVTSANKMKK